MSPNNVSSNKKSKQHETEGMISHLRIAAEKMMAERYDKKTDELEKENFKSDFVSKYQKAVSEAKARFEDESKICNKVIDLILPLQQETISFAKQYSIFPPEFNEIPVLPIQISNKIITPRINSDLGISSWFTNERIVEKYQSENSQLMQEHVTGVCGIYWGHKANDESYSVYGVELNISCVGEVKIGDYLFTLSEIGNSEFRNELSNIFYSPKRIHNYPDLNFQKNSGNQKKETRSFYKKTFFTINYFFRHFNEFWTLLWSEPQFEINNKTSLLKKIWYGFPNKDESPKEFRIKE